MDEWDSETFAGRPVIRFSQARFARQSPGEPVAWAVESFDVAPAAPLDMLVVGEPTEMLYAPAPGTAALRALFVGWSYVCYQTNPTDVGRLLGAYPELETLRLLGMPEEQQWRRPLRHSSLRELTIETAGLSAPVAQVLAASELPALEHLELWIGVRRHGASATMADLAPILAGQRFPRLRHLGLCAAEQADDVAAAVATAPVVAQLDTLDLSQGTLGDAGAEALLHGQPLTHLRTLNLSHHFLSDAMQKRLTVALPGIVDLTDHREEWWEPESLEDGRYTIMRDVELAFMPVDE